MNLLRNPGFEADWEEEESNTCLIIPENGIPVIEERGEIRTPPYWLTWFQHIPGTWDQPEVRDAWKGVDPRRVQAGNKAMLFFTFGRRHKGGFLQRVENLEPGATYKLTAFAHAWSNHRDNSQPDAFPHPDDPKWSEGAGYNIVSWRPDQVPQEDTGDPQTDAKRNFRFRVGIDPTGSIDPTADTIVWGPTRHNYNGYLAEPLEVTAVATSDAITVFLHTSTDWPFKHNDAYFDTAELIRVSEEPPVEPPPSGRGEPRVQYKRTYTLLSPKMDALWAIATVETTWDKERFTVGSSADDSGIGNLDERRIIACNPQDWSTDLVEFYRTYYPGIMYLAIEAATPEALREAMSRNFNDEDFEVVEPIEPPVEPPPVEPPPAKPVPWKGLNVIGLHVQRPTACDGYGDLEFVRDVPGIVKTVDYMEQHRYYKQVSDGKAVTLYRKFTDHQGQYWDLSPRIGARKFLETFLDSLKTNADWVDYVEGLNEIGIACGQVEGIKRHVDFECAFADVLHEEMGDAVAPALLAVAVGNPEHAPSGEIELLIPAVQQVVKYGGLINYHGYHRVQHKQVSPAWADNWFHFAGRCLASWDPVFNAHGLYPNYVLGEGGAFLDAVAGWRHREVFAGDWNAYLNSLLQLRDYIVAWNAEHNDRCAGVSLFTYKPEGGDWQRYNLYGYLDKLATALRGRAAGGRATYAKDFVWYYSQ